jgi:predicted RNA polymerase sigma factor
LPAGHALLAPMLLQASRLCYLLPAVLGGLWLKLGNPARAAHHYGDALARSCSAPESRFLKKQLARCAGV